MSRADRVREAQLLRAEGGSYQEISEHLGVAPSTVNNYLTDPDLSKQRARRRRYSGACVDCGAATDGSDGPGKGKERCSDCSPAAHGVARKVWTVEAVIDAIQDWAEEYGEPPRQIDWNPHVARKRGQEALARRFEDARGCWPASSTVVRACGSWNAAIRAAGFKPRPALRPR